MTTKLLKQALQQALDELKFYADPTVYDADFMGRRHRITYVADSAIIAIEAALALPVEPEVKHEPMAWMFQHGETGRWAYLANDGMNHPVNFAAANPRYGRAVPLYIHPQAALPVEPAPESKA